MLLIIESQKRGDVVIPVGLPFIPILYTEAAADGGKNYFRAVIFAE